MQTISEILGKFGYGPEVGKSILILSSDDVEGGGYDVYSGDGLALREASKILRDKKIEARAYLVEVWKKYQTDRAYPKHYEYTILIIHLDGTREDFSLPEELTGL